MSNDEPSFVYTFPPWSKVLLEKLTRSQLVKKFPAFCGTQRFITAFTNANHLSLFWASSIQSIPHILLFPFPLFRSYQNFSPSPRLSLWIFRNKICFYVEALLPPRRKRKLWGHPLSAVRNCLFNIFANTNCPLLLIVILFCLVN